MNIHTIECPACHGSGKIHYELIPNHPSGRMGTEECPVCHGGWRPVIDLSKCAECGENIIPDGDEGVTSAPMDHGRFEVDVGICGKCNRGEGSK